MLRAVLIFAALALGASAARADGECITPESVKQQFLASFPAIQIREATGEQSDAIEAGLRRVGGKLRDADRTFLVIGFPQGSQVMVAGFIGGCMEDIARFSAETVEDWLGGEKAAR